MGGEVVFECVFVFDDGGEVGVGEILVGGGGFVVDDMVGLFEVVVDFGGCEVLFDEFVGDGFFGGEGVVLGFFG